MDIGTLKNGINEYITAMKNDGKNFSYVSLLPLFYGYPETSYTLKLKADWIDKSESLKIAIDYLTDKMYDILDSSIIEIIFNIDIVKPGDDIEYNKTSIVLINELENQQLAILAAKLEEYRLKAETAIAIRQPI